MTILRIRKIFFFFLEKNGMKRIKWNYYHYFVFIKNNSNRISKGGNMHIDTPTQRGMQLFADNSD